MKTSRPKIFKITFIILGSIFGCLILLLSIGRYYANNTGYRKAYKDSVKRSEKCQKRCRENENKSSKNPYLSPDLRDCIPLSLGTLPCESLSCEARCGSLVIN